MATIKSLEEKAKAYDEAIERAKFYKGLQAEMEFIFPELKKESEDERVIKNIKKVIGWYRGMFTEKSLIPEEYQEIDAWLENQGEHKKFRDSIQVGDKVTRNEEGVLVNLSQLNRVAKKDEKQGEQKLTDSIWHDMTENPQGDKNDRTLVVFEDGYSTTSNALLHIGFGTSKAYKWAYVNDILRLTSNAKQSEQKPANWLQELEDKLANATPQQLADWKEKYFREEPAEWSEEDERMFDFAIRAIGLCKQYAINHQVSGYSKLPDVPERYEELQNWLKSLNERYTWKPSGEQVEAFEHFVRSIGESGYASPYDNARKLLYSLLQDLKKLKGE